MRVKKPGRDDRLDMTVVATEPPRMTCEESVGAGGRRRTRGTYRLEELPQGGTRISFELAWLEAPLVERRAAPLTRAVVKRQNQRSLCRLVEQLRRRPTYRRRYPMKVLITGGTGVLARAAMPLLREAGYEIDARGRGEIDLFAAAAVRAAVDGADAIMHLATHIPPRKAQADPAAWRENDRLRGEATSILVDAALDAETKRFVFPSITFVYPMTGAADESTPVAADIPATARSALAAEQEVTRFVEAGRQGVILRLGLLYGPGTGSDRPAERFAGYGSTLRIEDAGSALAASLALPSGIYNVASDGERISNRRLKELSGWRPEHSTPAPERERVAG